MNPATSRLLVLTDRRQVPPGHSLCDVLAAAAAGGLRSVVIRELDLGDDERSGLARRAGELGLDVIAARRPLAGAAGLHLGADAPAPVGGPVAAPWGRSCHSVCEVGKAAADGAAWVTLSPWASSASKPGYGPPVAPHAYADLPVPAYALGGIGPDNAGAAVAAGAHGVAVMGAVMRADDPAAVVVALLGEVAS